MVMYTYKLLLIHLLIYIENYKHINCCSCKKNDKNKHIYIKNENNKQIYKDKHVNEDDKNKKYNEEENNKNENNKTFNISKIDLSKAIKIGNGKYNDIYKFKYKDKYVVFSKNKFNGELYKRFSIDYIAKNTFYKFFFSKNQPTIYNEYFCEFVNGYSINDRSYAGNIIYAVNNFNNNSNNLIKLDIDDKIKNKLIIQDIIFRTGDQGPSNQIYLTEDIEKKKIIKDVIFIDLDFTLHRYNIDDFQETDDIYIFNNGKIDKNNIVPINKEIQQELIKILDINIQDFINELNKNIDNAVNKNEKFIKYTASEKYNDKTFTFNIVDNFNFPIVKIYEKNKNKNNPKINFFEDFKDCEKDIYIKNKITDYFDIKYEDNKIYIKYNTNDIFHEITDNLDIYAKIKDFTHENKSFYYNNNGHKIILPNIYFKYSLIENKSIDYLDFKEAKKEIISTYLTYIIDKINLCICSGDFDNIKEELLKLQQKYLNFLKNLNLTNI